MGLQTFFDVEKWIAARAPDGKRCSIDRSCADPSELFGPELSAFDAWVLWSRSGRGSEPGAKAAGVRLTQRYAAAAIDRASRWSVEGEGIGECAHWWPPPAWEPLPLLFEPKSGSLLRGADGAAFAVVSAPLARKRGRPSKTAGDAGWRFQQCRLPPPTRWIELPQWAQTERTAEGRILLPQSYWLDS